MLDKDIVEELLETADSPQGHYIEKLAAIEIGKLRQEVRKLSENLRDASGDTDAYHERWMRTRKERDTVRRLLAEMAVHATRLNAEITRLMNKNADLSLQVRQLQRMAEGMVELAKK